MTAHPENWALIGSTGFVGATLSRHISFADSFNSSTIQDISGREFDTVVCAGAPAVKWAANKDPDGDISNLVKLMDALKEAKIRHIVLVSTIDVYPEPANVDELSVPGENLEAYGRNRRALELFVEREFERSTIIRLPGLFGEGLKKNIIFDLMNDNNIGAINPASRFQWYPMDRLHSDLDKIIESNIRLVNISPEPIETADLLSSIFPNVEVGPSVQPAPYYDMQTIHASLLGGVGRYHISASEIMKRLDGFVTKKTA